MLRISTKKVVAYIILAIILAFVFKYLVDNPQIFDKLRNLNISEFFVLSLFVVLVLIVNGFRAKILTEIFTNSKLSFKEWFGLSTLNTLGNYSPFQGGFVARGYYLKNYYKIPYSHFASSILTSTLLTFSTFSFLSALAILFGFLTKGLFYTAPFWLFTAIGISGVSVILLLPKLRKRRNPKNLVGRTIHSLIDGWEVIGSNKTILLKLISVDLVALIIVSLRFFYAALILDVGISLIQSVIISAMAMVTLLVNITPGAIGIRETIAGFSATVVGANLVDGILVASLERAVILFWVIVIGVPFSIYFTKSLNNKMKQKDSA